MCLRETATLKDFETEIFINWNCPTLFKATGFIEQSLDRHLERNEISKLVQLSILLVMWYIELMLNLVHYSLWNKQFLYINLIVSKA